MVKDKIKKFDDYFVELLNNRIKTDFLDRFLYKVTNWGGAIGSTVISIIFLIIGFVLSNRLVIVGLEGLVVLGLSQIVVQIVKNTVRRIRPYDAVEGLHTFGIDMPDFSFPSGHTTAAFSLAAVLILNIPYLWPLGLIFAFTIGISRIYLAVHYPTDVLAGIILGTLSAVLIHIYIFPYILEILLNFLGQ